MPFKTLPTALETRELAGVHSFQPVTPTTTLALALERWSSTPEIPIPQSALQRCCSTLPAHRTRPLELARSVRYEQVNAMLLNEFLKAHRRMEEQDKRIEELTAQLKQQAAQIQKVSAKIEGSKPAPQVVSNP